MPSGFDDFWARRILAFPDSADRTHLTYPLHTTLDTRLNYRVSHALHAGTANDENVLLATGANRRVAQPN